MATDADQPFTLAFSAYLADPRRAVLLGEFGEVFTVKHAVEVDTITEGPLQ